MNKHLHWRAYIGLSVIAIAIEIAVGVAVFRLVSTTEQNSLRRRAATIAASIESSEVISLAGDESDLDNPVYQELKGKMTRTKEANTDIRFVYITGQRDGNVFFYIDNEPAESPDNSPPGQIFTEVTPEFRAVFADGQAIIEGPSADRWGTWLTGLAPVFDPDTGKVIAVAGLDVSANEYYKRVITTTSVAVLLVGLFLLLLITIYMLYVKEKELDRAKSEFVSMASHQLKTPLTTISWYAETLLHGEIGNITAEQKKYLEKISNSCWRMAALVNEFLNVSRIELGVLRANLQPTKLIEVADGILDELMPQIKEKKLQIIKNYEQNLPVINIDPQLARMIFQNLLSNAVKYTQNRGTINLAIETRGADIFIKVSDNGYGIPKIQQSQIFQKLFRGDNIKNTSSEGAGFGLYIVKSVVEQIGGKIWFESAENKGTTFYVTIPLVQGSPPIAR